ncbi:13543_t:CDS:2, partial [Dentiscutata erythropus]
PQFGDSDLMLKNNNEFGFKVFCKKRCYEFPIRETTDISYVEDYEVFQIICNVNKKTARNEIKNEKMNNVKTNNENVKMNNENVKTNNVNIETVEKKNNNYYTEIVENENNYYYEKAISQCSERGLYFAAKWYILYTRIYVHFTISTRLIGGRNFGWTFLFN